MDMIQQLCSGKKGDIFFSQNVMDCEGGMNTALKIGMRLLMHTGPEERAA